MIYDIISIAIIVGVGMLGAITGYIRGIDDGMKILEEFYNEVDKILK